MKALRLVSGFALVTVVASATLAVGIAALVPPTGDLAFDTTSFSSRTLSLDPLEQRSRVMWSDGTPMTDLYYGFDRSPVKLRAVPPHLIDAVIAIEDRDFFEHGGWNLRALGRALYRDIEGESGLQGGSTITQQLVKISQFPDADRTVSQKVFEMSVAAQFEEQYTKEAILERYLNSVYFGNGAYGVKAAAERYFNRGLQRLTVGQAALLAGLIRSPEGLNPIENPEGARARRDAVINAMVETDFLERERARRAKLEPIPRRVYNNARYAPDSYFLAAMVDHLVNQDTEAARALGPDAESRRLRLYRGGLKITTTLDRAMQSQGEATVRAHTPPDTPVTGALVALDNTNGAVRAMVGGIDFATSKYNLATQGARQPGSSFKTYVLATALEAGFSPNDLILGESRCSFRRPLATTPPDPYVVSAHGGGVMSLRTAITESINCAFVRLVIALGHGELGPARVVETARRLGVSGSDLSAVTSLALGTSGVTPLEMAAGYSTIAADGQLHLPEYVSEIVDSDGTVVYRARGAGVAVMKPQVARELTEMLRGPVRSGTAAGTLGDFPRPAAGKTGTTDSNVDAWFVGYTPQLTTAVWVGQPTCGDNSNPACSLTPYLGDDAFGGRVPARIWGAFMSAALAGQPVLEFTAPDPRLIPSAQYIHENGRLVRLDLPGTTTTTAAPATTTTRPRPTTTMAPPTTTTSPPTSTTGATTTTVPGP